MLFSATYDKDVMDFAENIVPNPVVSITVFRS
jgi:superfamily II DNA/RNA helicase